VALLNNPIDGAMTECGISGTEGYSKEAEQLLVRYESYSFDDVHSDVLHLLPGIPGVVLDIGSGTGRDAAHFAKIGHRVVAVEPTDELRVPASRLHPSPSIDWLDDSFPDLARVVASGEYFDVVMLTAVWMHLDATERARAMPVLASLVRPGGIMIMLLRHGPVPSGRRMFDVSAGETIALAQANRFRSVMNRHSDSSHGGNKRAGVTWTRLAFEKES
jgi:SAM-dependent methyltransferase